MRALQGNGSLGQNQQFSGMRKRGVESKKLFRLRSTSILVRSAKSQPTSTTEKLDPDLSAVPSHLLRYLFMRITAALPLLLLSAMALAQPQKASPPDQKDQVTVGLPQSGRYPTEAAPLPIRVVESPGDAAHSKEREAKADKHDAEDLEAQVRTADATERQAILSLVAIVISSLGLIGLALTFYETRRTAQAANASVRLAMREFNTVHRPRAIFRHVVLDDELWGRGKFGVRCRIVNVGGTEAKVVEYGVGHLVTKMDRELHPRPEYKIVPVQPVVLKSGEGHDLPLHELVMTDEKYLPNIQTGNYSLFCFGYVKYLDADGISRTTGFGRVLKRIGGTTAPAKICRFSTLKEEREEYEYGD
jgi:hypothetical protein